MIIQGGLNTEHPKSEPVQNMNVLEIGIGMVWFWNGRDYSYNYVLEPTTIKNRTRTKEYKMVSKKDPNHLKTESFINHFGPFEIRTFKPSLF